MTAQSTSAVAIARAATRRRAMQPLRRPQADVRIAFPTVRQDLLVGHAQLANVSRLPLHQGHVMGRRTQRPRSLRPDRRRPPATIGRPAATTQTPAAKRNCDRPYLVPTSHRTRSPAVQRFATMSHVRPSGMRASQAKYPRATVSSKSFLRRLDAQSARSGSAKDACAQRRRPWRSWSVNDSQKLGGLAVRPRRQQLCTSTGRFASRDCEAPSYIGCPPGKPA